MNAFTIICILILYGLTVLCFYLPFRSEKKQTAYIVSIILGLLITFTIIWELDFLVIFIYPIILIFQIIFIFYWIFSIFNRRKTGQIIALMLSISSLLLVMEPWISDWTFNKNDVKKILAFHNLELKEDFKILKNESGGFRDYYESFTLKLSDNDFIRISQLITTSKSYKGFFTNNSNNPLLDEKNDTIDFETENYFEREYATDKKMENGTYHFWFTLDKQNKELYYTGGDE